MCVNMYLSLSPKVALLFQESSILREVLCLAFRTSKCMLSLSVNGREDAYVFSDCYGVVAS